MPVVSDGFSQPGSIVRLKFFNFMQLEDTEFRPGPNLNVIIGPNGSGKSSIVNGICLGLAGKPSVLGRASSLKDFVKIGEQEAEVEVELYGGGGRSNVTVSRRWDLEGRSVWTLSGRKVGVREVERAVAEFRIQVDNLCQFLPQDKVHDFSRLDSKGLLDSTVDAVGEVQLKERHQELKLIQKSVGEGEELFLRKRQMLQEKKDQCQRLEEEVRAFDEKRKIEEKLVLIEGRLSWSKFSESRREAKRKQDAQKEVKQRWLELETSVNPLKTSLAKATNKRDVLEKKLQADNVKIKESMKKAKTHSVNIERLEEEIAGLKEELVDLDRQEEERADDVRKLRVVITELEAECQEEHDPEMEKKLMAARKEALKRQEAVEQAREERENMKYEQTTLGRQVKEAEDTIAQLNDVERQKLEVLRSKNSDAFKACLWLRDHRDQFQGDVFEPFIVSGNVTEPGNVKYIENAVKLRDLTAFFFSNAEDMNNFLQITRTDRGWKRVSAALVPAQPLEHLATAPDPAPLATFGLVSYLLAMVTAPDPVLAFLCLNHGLHRIPVFREVAEQHLDILTSEHGLTKLMVGERSHAVSVSQYSGARTTTTQTLLARGLLGVVKDVAEEEHVWGVVREKQELLTELAGRIAVVEKTLKGLNMEVENARKAHKELEQKKNFVARQAARVEAQRVNLRRLVGEAGVQQERSGVRREVAGLVRQMVKSVSQLRLAIGETQGHQVAVEVGRLGTPGVEAVLVEASRAVESAMERGRGLREELEGAERELEESKKVLGLALREAVACTGAGERRDEAPASVVEKWGEAELPSSREELEVLSQELEGEASCLDSVPQETVAEHSRLLEAVRELERDVRVGEEARLEAGHRLEELGTTWLASLERLVDRICSRFSASFASLGFAGEVVLHRGHHCNDFANYGLRIRVKFRDREPLQELSPHHQSGGERSVSTALYMLALQELTTVPFRCVDEINQGMDAVNERRVFDLLVRTSCQETSAQYFLLTPKLLPGLDYSPRMNVLIVNNGPAMCHHAAWSMEAFRGAVSG